MGGAAQTEQIVTSENLLNMGMSQTDINNIEQTCDVSNTASNIIQIVGSKVKNLDTRQQNELKNLCKFQQVLKSEKNADVSNKILNELSSQLKAKGDMFTSGADSKSRQEAINKTFVDIDQTTLNNIVQRCIVQQDLENITQIIGSEVTDSSINQVNKSIGECITSNETVQQMVSKNEAEQGAKSKVEGTTKSSSANFFMSMGGSILSFIIIASVIAFFVYNSLGGKGGGQELAKQALSIYAGGPVAAAIPTAGG